MNIKKILTTLVCVFTTINIWAQYTCYVGGADIKIYAPSTNYSRYPDLYEVRWNIQGGGTNVITLIGNTVNPVTVRPIGAGTATVMCSATYYDKSLGNAAGKTTVIESYTVTCIDNSGGGDNGGGNNNGGGTGGGNIKDGDYFQDYTKEGQLMLFMAGTYWGEPCCYVVPNKYGGACISYANGRVTIPNSAKGFPVKGISSSAFKSLSGLTELVIPSTVETVSPSIIYMCENLVSVTCEATTPPSLQTTSGQVCNTDYKCVLYVPKGSVSKYESANGWKSFGAIKEIGSSIEKIKLTANPSGGEIEKGKTVTLSTDVSGADIYYTTNNTTPSKTNGTKYSTPITINQALTLRAIAYKVGYSDSEELKETYTIKETPISPTNISVSPSSKTIKVGETFTPTYTLTPSNATTTVTWSSDNSSIASVDKNTGKVTGVKAGSTYINATTANGKTDWCKVTVEETKVDPTSISVSPSSKTIKVGETFTPTYSLTPSNATTTVTWSSDNNSIASVDKNTGKVTGIKAGSTYINATTANGKKNWCKVTVEEEPSNGIAINETNFPDANFRNFLLEQDYGKDKILTEAEINKITSIHVPFEEISSLKGIEYFTALKFLFCPSNLLAEIDISRNTALEFLDCSYNQLTTLDIAKNTALEDLACEYNHLKTLDISKNTALTHLYCYNNQLTTLYVSGCTGLTNLYCSSNQLTALDVSGCTKLAVLNCYNNQIKGEYMDALINSLSQNTTNQKYELAIYDVYEENGNECTKAQVGAAKAKGWTVYYRDSAATLAEYYGCDADPIKITLPEMQTINVNEMVKLIPAIEPKYITSEITWKSNDTSIAMVNSTGTVIGIKEGTTIVSASTSNGLVAECFIIVTFPDGIDGVKADDSDEVPVYNLSGQQVKHWKGKKGIYIVKGKKIVVK